MKKAGNDLRGTMKHAFIILAVCLVAAGCSGDTLEAEDVKIVIDLPEAPKKDKPTLYPVLDSKAGRYGLKNNKNQWVINLVFENDGLVRLRDGYYLFRKIDEKGISQYIFLDKYGDNVFGKSFQNTSEFASGIALAMENDRMAIINRAGSIVDKVPEQDESDINKKISLDGRLLIASGKSSIQDETGKIKVRDVWTGKTLYGGNLHYGRNVPGRFAVLNDTVKETTYLYGYNGMIKTIKGYYALRSGLEEIIMAPYKRKDPYAGDLYVYNLNNNGISPFTAWKNYGERAVLEKILEFENNKKLYVYMVNAESNILMLYKEPMTKDNKEVRFGSILGEFAEGLAPIEIEFRGSHFIYIDEDGQYVFASTINGEFQNAFEFVDGFALVQLGARREGRFYNDKWCYVDKTGDIIIREDLGYIAETGKWILQ